MAAFDRTSTAAVILRGGSVFIARRLPKGVLADLWEFPGGKVDAGETPEEALAREMQEEFEWPVKPGALFCEGSFENKGKRFRLLAFSSEAEGDPPALHEHTEYRWVPIGDLPSYSLAPSDEVIAETLKKHNNK